MLRNAVVVILTFCAGSITCEGCVPVPPISPIPTSPAVPQSSLPTFPPTGDAVGQSDLTSATGHRPGHTESPADRAAAQQTAAAAGQRTTEVRAPYYPVLNGEITGAQAQRKAASGPVRFRRRSCLAASDRPFRSRNW